MTGPTNDPLAVTAHDGSALRDLLTMLFRHRAAALGAFVAVSGAGIAWMLTTTPIYEVTASIVLKDDWASVPVAPTETRDLIINTVTEEDLNSEVEILRSRELLATVIQTQDAEPVAHPTGWLDRLVDRFGALGANPRRTPLDDQVLSLERNLRVEPIPKSKVVEIAYRTEDPDRGVDLVEVLIDRYLERRLQVYQHPQALSFFQDQTAAARTRLQEAEDALEAYTQSAAVSIPLDPQKQVVLEKLGQVDRQLAEARAEVDQRAKIVAALEAQLEREPARLPTADRQHLDPAIEQIQVGLVTLQLQRDEVAQSFGPDNRKTRDLDTQITLAEARLAEARRRVGAIDRTELNQIHQDLRSALASARADLEGARGRAVSIEEQANLFQVELDDLNRKGFVFERLQRDVTSARETFLLYTKKREESRISDAMDQQQIVNVSVLHQPRAPLEPVRPNTSISLVLALVLATICSLAVTFGGELLDHSIVTGHALEQHVAVRHLVSVPETPEL